MTRWFVVGAVAWLAGTTGAGVAGEPAPLRPGDPVEYRPLAFRAEVWAERQVSTLLWPWTGTNVVFLTTNRTYDGVLMARWVQRLDAGWALYADLTGARPRPLKQLDGRATIAAVPDFDFTLLRRSDLSFLKRFTNADGLTEKQPRVRDADGRWVNPSDQPVTYASAMLRLWREHGGNAWLRRFFRALADCPSAPPTTPDYAQAQSWYWLVAASVAARRDLTPVFAGDWGMPLSEDTRRAFAAVDWAAPDTTVPAVLARIRPHWGARTLLE